MPRKARIVIPESPHHITQRGNKRSIVFFSDSDYALYLELLHTYSKKYFTHVLAYCLMTNHVHLILVPEQLNGLALTLKATHMRYAAVINARLGWTGHLWQQRYFSAPLDTEYFWTAVRYVERNPVKAKLVTDAADYRWSSARAHCGYTSDKLLTTASNWVQLVKDQQDWHSWLMNEDDDKKIQLLRNRTESDLPCGDDTFIKRIESQLGRTVLPQVRGRKKK